MNMCLILKPQIKQKLMKLKVDNIYMVCLYIIFYNLNIDILNVKE